MKRNMGQEQQLSIQSNCLFNAELPLCEAILGGDTQSRMCYRVVSLRMTHLVPLPIPPPYRLHLDASVRLRLFAVDATGEAKMMWRVWRAGEDEQLVKYTSRYGAEVHRAWAEAGLAPKLLSCLRLPGGMFEVRMELLQKKEGWADLSELREEDPAFFAAALLQAQSVLRRARDIPMGQGEKKGVHGDMRAPNVLVRARAEGEWDVQLVDFDWAGTDGENVYPPFMSSDIEWPEGVQARAVMKQEHDIKLLATY